MPIRRHKPKVQAYIEFGPHTAADFATRTRSGGGKLNRAESQLAMYLHDLKFPIHRIGALFDVNQGRIAEAIKRCK